MNSLIMKKKYDEIITIFNSNNCELYTSKDEYDNMLGASSCKFTFKASCGHDNSVTLTNFIQKKSGIICKNCMKQQISNKLIEFHKDNDQPASKVHVQENEVFNKIEKILNKDFDVKKTNEGCAADFIIKPKNINENKWLGIQLKTTRRHCHGLYSFNLHKNNYENMIILCYCLDDNIIWCIPYDIISHVKNTFNIGLTNKSIYSKYIVSESLILQKLNEYFDIMNLNKSDVFMIPLNICQQNEIKYIKIREKYCDFIQFVKPKIEQSYFDFIINGKKIQEKVATKRNDREDSYIACIYRGGNYVNRRQYIVGMNDYYWIHIPNTHIFYILPEIELYNNGFIQKPLEKINTKFFLNLKVNIKKYWYYKYQYNYKNLDKEFLLKLFN